MHEDFIPQAFMHHGQWLVTSWQPKIGYFPQSEEGSYIASQEYPWAIIFPDVPCVYVHMPRAAPTVAPDRVPWPPIFGPVVCLQR
jgi:hypothetical protein